MCVSLLSHTSTNSTFLSKATNYFSHMLLQRWEAKIRRKDVASTRDQTHNHQVTSPTPSPLSHPGRAAPVWASKRVKIIYPFIQNLKTEKKHLENIVLEAENAAARIFCISHNLFNPCQNKFHFLGSQLFCHLQLLWVWAKSSLNFFRLVKELTLYHTILTFDNPTQRGCRIHCRKRRKCWKPAFSPLSAVFLLYQREKSSF